MASEFCMWQEASGQRRLKPGPDASLEVSRVTCGFLCIPTWTPLGLLVFDLPSQRSRGTCETSKAGSQTEVRVRSDSQAAFWGAGSQSRLLNLEEGAGNLSRLLLGGEASGSAAGPPQLRPSSPSAIASPLPPSFCELCRGYRSPAWGCRAFKEMFLFMQRCQISYASWHGVTAFMPPCLSLLTPISFYHCAAPWSFSAGFMFQPDCV